MKTTYSSTLSLSKTQTRSPTSFFFSFCLLPVLMISAGCSLLGKAEAEAQAPKANTQKPSITAVDAAIARNGILQETPTYIGTTKPYREVSLRSQVEGRLLNLTVNIGEPVVPGQIIAQLDETILTTAVTQAEAELAARESEVLRAQNQVKNAQAKAEQAGLELKQANANAARREFLAKQGAISQQDAELSQTAVKTNQKIENAAIEQIRTEQQAVEVARSRVEAQKALVAQAKERQSHATITSPMQGVVIARISEPGNLIQPGNEILKIGDFNRVKIDVPVSELELSNIKIGQAVEVQLDAFPKDTFSGVVSRIYPTADATARLIPVEVIIRNDNDKIGSGLLARVNFSQLYKSSIIVAQTALTVGGEAGEKGNKGEKKPGKTAEKGNKGKNTTGTIFIVTEEGGEAKVTARQVKIGDRLNGQVEILSGLKAGEKYVIRSGKPLKDGESVRLSVLSEK